jgi:hypothetical protein
MASHVFQKNLASLYKDFQYEMVALVDEKVSDEISTTQAADAEPEFFDYAKKEEVAAAPAPAPKKEEAVKEVVTENNTDEVSENNEVINNVEESAVVDNKVEEIAVDDLIAFDYSKANQDVKAQTVPTVSKVTTQALGASPNYASIALPNTIVPMPEISKNSAKPVKVEPVTTQEEENQFVDMYTENVKMISDTKTTKAYSSRVTIQISGTDLKKTQSEVGFEVRFQDDLTEILQDYNSGDINLDSELSRPTMTRSVAVLKRGFTPTNTDLILEDGVTGVTLPLIEEDKFNELLAPFESRGPLGAVLVELDDDVEGAALDVPFSQVLLLDSDMKVTEGEDFSYQLFVGVKAGNALLSYKGLKGSLTSKIIHIHEREVTFESNFFENVKNERVRLVEEDLLSKEKTPLIISSEEVKEFATNKTAKKINNHTYETDFNRILLGGRKYLELSHQSEPIFAGYKDATTLEIPAENFMRYILSRFEGSKLGNRCLIQMNLKKKALKVDVAAESVGSSLMTYTQILDADGKFYDSVSPKSKKVIVVGENQGAPEFGHDGKVNFKISYEDGSVEFLGSYCSPNTYLVEQL